MLLKTVCDNCVGSIARRVCTVAQSDRSGFASAAPAGSKLLSANFALGTRSRTDDSPGIRTQRPAVRQLSSNFLSARSQCLQENLWTTARFRSCPIWGVVLTDRDKLLLSELRWAWAMALSRCVVSRYATAWAESLEGVMSGHWPCSAAVARFKKLWTSYRPTFTKISKFVSSTILLLKNYTRPEVKMPLLFALM